MTETVAFERSHDILIDAPPKAVFDYVSNPRSWPEWIAVSHEVDSPDRPLITGETFREKWFSREEIQLDWVVLKADSPRCWVARTHAGFIGPIIVRYDFEPVGQGTRYRRTVSNPARPKPPTEAMIGRIDAEAATALGNIKAQVERRVREGRA
ncbi:MAG: SRPBCC family protein [Betaproteobacteria bacterium]|nr:SRPBCC family protein [Betaproteobacteria bacterium]